LLAAAGGSADWLAGLAQHLVCVGIHHPGDLLAADPLAAASRREHDRASGDTIRQSHQYGAAANAGGPALLDAIASSTLHAFFGHRRVYPSKLYPGSQRLGCRLVGEM